jgi:hypothetical protein
MTFNQGRKVIGNLRFKVWPSPGICKNRAPKCQVVNHAGLAVSLEDLSWTTDRDLRRGGYRAHEPLLRRVSTVVVPYVLGRRQIADSARLPFPPAG